MLIYLCCLKYVIHFTRPDVVISSIFKLGASFLTWHLADYRVSKQVFRYKHWLETLKHIETDNYFSYSDCPICSSDVHAIMSNWNSWYGIISLNTNTIRYTACIFNIFFFKHVSITRCRRQNRNTVTRDFSIFSFMRGFATGFSYGNSVNHNVLLRGAKALAEPQWVEMSVTVYACSPTGWALHLFDV